MSSTSGLVHLRSVERSTSPCAAVALAEEGVLLAAEVVQHLVVREAAAVEAHVEDDRLLVEVVRVQARARSGPGPPRPCWGCGCSPACPCSARRPRRRCAPPSARTSGRRSPCAAGRLDLDAAASVLRVGLGLAATCSSTVSPTLSLSSWLRFALVRQLDAVDGEDDVAGLRLRPRLSAGPRLRISAIFRPGPR